MLCVQIPEADADLEVVPPNNKRRLFRRGKHRWIYSPMAFINCCLTRTNSVPELSPESNASAPSESTPPANLDAESDPPVAVDDNIQNDDNGLDELDASSDAAVAMPDQNLEPVTIYEPYAMRRMPVAGMTPPAPPPFHTQIDYENCLVPDLLAITNSTFYWGKMDRYEAERLLEGKPEGTFLLRDSAQEDHLFSVSFRRFERSLHARIEHWQHRFSFDAHDPGVFSSLTVTGLIEYYKDPSHCMYFEPILTKPLHRTFTFSLQHLARATICDQLGRYDQIHRLPLPPLLKAYLKEYHYRIKLRTRYLDEAGPYRWLGPSPSTLYSLHQRPGPE